MNEELNKFFNDVIEVKGDIKVLHTKVDGCIQMITALTSGIGKRVEDHSEKIAKFEEKFTILETTSNNVYRKIQKHIDDHWKFITIMIGLLTVISVLLKIILKV